MTSVITNKLVNVKTKNPNSNGYNSAVIGSNVLPGSMLGNFEVKNEFFTLNVSMINELVSKGEVELKNGYLNISIFEKKQKNTEPEFNKCPDDVLQPEDIPF